jgi:hypothetical protein
LERQEARDTRRSRRSSPAAVVLAVLLCAPVVWTQDATIDAVQVLRPTGELPARLIEPIENPRAFVETSTGVALVLDAGTQSIYAFNSARTSVRKIVDVGTEPGHLIRPSGFSLGPNDIFAVADAPTDVTRVQYFGDDGRFLNLFYLPARGGVRQSLGHLAMDGAGPVAFTGRTFVFNLPMTGSLMSEFDVFGTAVTSIGALRPTGHEADPALHAELNAGLPLLDPTGGYYFVFDTGVPMFRKYDAAGRLRFERHVEGPELDDALKSLPGRWPERTSGSDAWPYVPSLVRTAAVDRGGRLWIALASGRTYVYDARGEKIRTVQFDADGPLAPISLFFARRDRVLVTPGGYEFSSAIGGR